MYHRYRYENTGTILVGDIPVDEHITLCCDSQDVKELERSTSVDLSDYGSVFVEASDGEVVTFWGVGHAVPLLDDVADIWELVTE